MSTVLLGATKEHQIEENLKALAVAKKLTKEMMKEIDDIVGTKPSPANPMAAAMRNIKSKVGAF